jgi:hypothetical protein
MERAQLSDYRDYLTTIGVNYRMRKNFSFVTEGTLGRRGSGGKFGFIKETAQGGKIYAEVASGYSESSGTNGTSTKAGVSGQLSGKSSAYAEYGSTSSDDDSTLRKTVGINTEYNAGGGLMFTMSAERSNEISSLNGAYITNAANLGAAYRSKFGFRLDAHADYRRNSGSISKDQFGFHFPSEGRLKNDLNIFSEYDYVVDSNIKTGTTETKYVKSIIGLAYRPADNDRLNLFLRAGRIRELRSPAVNRILDIDSVSTVLSLEGLYELSPSLILHEKIASKLIKENVSFLPTAKTRTTLWISGLTWKPGSLWDFDLEYRTKHQPTNLNHADGLALEAGFTVKKKFRLGAGYNFSSYTDDEFASESYSWRGMFFRLQLKN